MPWYLSVFLLFGILGLLVIALVAVFDRKSEPVNRLRGGAVAFAIVAAVVVTYLDKHP